MDYSREHSQLMTCFQFVKKAEINGVQVVIERDKVYNKLVHLLTNGEFKWISMSVDKIFNAS